MKILGAWLAILLISTSTRAAQQIEFKLLTDQTEYLSGEMIPVSARIVNYSGQTLKLGAAEDWLTFNVDGQGGLVVNKYGNVPVVKEFDLESAKMVTKTVNLTPYFDLSKPGRYVITATATIPAWNARVSSDTKVIDVVPGLRLWEQEFGMPSGSAPTQGLPEVRKYVLQKVNYKDSMKLYLRLTDASESHVFKVFPIGQMISFSRIEPKLDQFNNLHVIYQTASRTFLYTMIDPAGELIVRQTHDYTTARPRLAVDENGKVVVVGGVRHLLETDIPPSNGLLPVLNLKTPTP